MRHIISRIFSDDVTNSKRPQAAPTWRFAMFMMIIITASFAQQKDLMKYVAVVETQIDDRSGAAAEINKAEVSELTNEIRREAVRNLPGNRFSVMTAETVLAMGEAVLEECAEENCVIALGTKIGADYIVRGTISKFRQNFSLTVEIFETEYGMLVATAASIRSANLDEILEKTPEACAEMYKSFLERLAAQASRQTAAVTPEPAASVHEPVALPPPAVAPTPPPAPPKPPKPEPAVKQSAPKEKSSGAIVAIRWSSAALAVGGIVGGIIVNGTAESEYDSYKDTRSFSEADKTRKNTEDYISTRNLLYILGGIGLAGFTVTLFF